MHHPRWDWNPEGLHVDFIELREKGFTARASGEIPEFHTQQSPVLSCSHAWPWFPRVLNVVLPSHHTRGAGLVLKFITWQCAKNAAAWEECSLLPLQMRTQSYFWKIIARIWTVEILHRAWPSSSVSPICQSKITHRARTQEIELKLKSKFEVKKPPKPSCWCSSKGKWGGENSQ